MNKNKLLSIGEISKYTGVGIKSLRYYEQINILKPAYVNPDSGYRYYTFNQTYLVDLIMFYVELDIPLKELSEFIDGQENINFLKLLLHGKEAALKKMKTLKRGLEFIDFLEQKISMQEKYPMGQIYTQELPEKTFHLVPFEQSLNGIDEHKIFKSYLEIPYDEDDENNELPEYGYLCEYLPSDIRRYLYIEMPRDKATENCKIVPRGTYFCKQSDINQIEQATEIFKGYLTGKDSFLAIETEVFTSIANINKPIYELRIIAL